MPAGSRFIKACNLCHERKIKCDGRLPRCGPCARANLSECNMDDSVMWTTAHVRELEARIDWLEGLVGLAFEDGGMVQGFPTGTAMQVKGAGRTGASNGSDLFAEEIGLLSLRASGSYIGSMSGITLGRLVASAIAFHGQESCLFNVPSDEHGVAPPRPQFGTAYPPFHLASSYVLSYLSRVHRWYPFLDISRLGSDLSAVYSDRTTLDDSRRFTLMLVFALGCGDGLDPNSADDYLQSALPFLPTALAERSIDTVRCILLLCMFSLRSWKGGLDVWQLAGHGIRLAISLGLTRNSYTWESDEKEREARRRVWWAMYAVERLVATDTGRVLAIRNEGIDAHPPREVEETLPDSLQDFLHQPNYRMDLRPAIHLVSQRRLLGDIMECVYVTRPADRPSMSIDETSNRVAALQTTLVRWQQDALKLVLTRNADNKVIQLAFHSATLLLHCPSPSFPCPPPEVLEVCMVAARGTISIGATTVREGAENEVMPGWAGFRSIFNSGLVLMYCSWAGVTCPSAIKPGVDTVSDPDIDASLQALQTLTQRHGLSTTHVDLYERVIAAVTRILCQPLIDILGGPPDMADVATVALDVGLAPSDGLELDQYAVDFINRLLSGEDIMMT